MRAINLIPHDARRGGGAGAGGRSRGAVYMILGGLAGLVVLAGLWALAGRDASRARVELAGLQEQAATAQRQAATLAPYSTYSQLRASRADAVRSLATARFEWARTLDAIARVLPADVRLGALNGALPGAAAAGTAPPAAAPSSPSSPASVVSPSVQITGCAPSMAAVAKLMPRLRVVPGVASISLGSSTTPGKDAPGGTPIAGCDRASFQMTLSFASAAPATAPGATTTTAAAATGGGAQ